MTWQEFFKLVKLKMIETAGEGTYPEEQIARNAIIASDMILNVAPLEILDDKNVFEYQTQNFASSLNTPYTPVQLPNDFRRLLAVEVNLGNGFKTATYYDLNEFLTKRSLFPNDKALMFTKYGSLLLIAPILSPQNTVNVKYLGNRLAWTSSNNLMFFSRQLLTPLLYYTCGLLSIDDGNYNVATSFMNLYTNSMMEIINVYKLTPPRIGITPEEEQQIIRGKPKL